MMIDCFPSDQLTPSKTLARTENLVDQAAGAAVEHLSLPKHVAHSRQEGTKRGARNEDGFAVGFAVRKVAGLALAVNERQLPTTT